MLLFRESDVRRLLPMPAAIAALRRAFADLAAGRAQNQPRRRLVLPGGAALHSMAGSFSGYFGTKIYSTHPRHGTHFLFVLYRAEDAAPLALFEANYLGQIRTGAASGLAADLLAPPEASTVAVIGAGFQARSQLEAVLAVRTIRQVRVWSRTAERTAEFVREASERSGVVVEQTASAADAVQGADIVVTATNSKEPVLEAGWVAPHALVNAIGSNHPQRRELPPDLVRRAALVVVDSREQARIESGDLLGALPEEEGHPPKLVELAAVVAGAAARPTEGITIFKSAGIGVEDVAAAAHVYEAAEKEKTGELPLAYS